MKVAPPAPDELEISVFGPGFGECIVVHLGDGDWMVVDSCVPSGSSEPIALTYLQEIGVDVAKCVKLIVVTHWHDDHMRGIAQLFRACSSARFVCSAALRTREFFTLIASEESARAKEGRSFGVSELADVLQELDRRTPGRARGSIGPEWANANQDLFLRAASTTARAAVVRALSPSSATVTVGLRAIGSALPDAGAPRRAVVSPEPNDTAVVLRVGLGDVNVLLGADLEVGTDIRRGWLGIMNDGLATTITSSAYKIAHHGSPNADHPGVWTSLLRRNPVAVLTPFLNGSVKLPSATDVERIRGNAARVLASSPPRPIAPASRDPAVDRTIRQVAKTRRQRTGRMGQVRLRHRGNEWAHELFDAALEL